MKKVRIMLVATAVLGTIGGALAFKAMTFGDFKYCISSDPAAKVCPVFSFARFAAVGATPYAYTPTVANFCPVDIGCQAVGRFNP